MAIPARTRSCRRRGAPAACRERSGERSGRGQGCTSRLVSFHAPMHLVARAIIRTLSHRRRNATSLQARWRARAKKKKKTRLRESLQKVSPTINSTVIPSPLSSSSLTSQPSHRFFLSSHCAALSSPSPSSLPPSRRSLLSWSVLDKHKSLASLPLLFASLHCGATS